MSAPLVLELPSETALDPEEFEALTAATRLLEQDATTDAHAAAPSHAAIPHAAPRWSVVAAIGVVIAGYALWQAAPALNHVGAAAAAGHSAAHALEGAVATAAEAAHHAAPAPAAFSVIPFAALLLSIALLPLFHGTAHWWENNLHRFYVSAGCAAATLAYYTFLYGHGLVDHFTHTTSAPGLAAAGTLLRNALLAEYVPFIVLLFGLFVVSGGIAIDGSLRGTPRLNAGLIGIGGMLASFIGTTGAAMLLIRPLLRANGRRLYVAHTVIFFIFVVCNTGGCLLPIGDPPLFLGYLKGVPFFWTTALFQEWLFVNACLIGVYWVWDQIAWRKESAAARAPDLVREPLALRGALNFAWLGAIIAAVALLDPSKALPGTNWHAPLYLREVVILGLAAASLAFTPQAVRSKNHFNYDAILEVAVLFLGIFVCMQAPMQLLNAYGAQLGIAAPWQFFWATGGLSSFLDNAPTYALFFEIAKEVPASNTLALADGSVLGVRELAAVSLGAVFMGANTYIGNGPNFMVKTIAEKSNVKMPSFFGYMLYSGAVLIPLLAVVSWLFL